MVNHDKGVAHLNRNTSFAKYFFNFNTRQTTYPLSTQAFSHYAMWPTPLM